AHRGVETGDDVEERGLAGTVGPDEPDDLVLVDREADAVEHLEPAEAERDVVDVEVRVLSLSHGRPPPAARAPGRPGRSPPGPRWTRPRPRPGPGRPPVRPRPTPPARWRGRGVAAGWRRK